MAGRAIIKVYMDSGHISHNMPIQTMLSENK